MSEFPSRRLLFERLTPEESCRRAAFLAGILGRPKHERPYLLVPVGYPALDARVPDIVKKPLAEVREVV